MPINLNPIFRGEVQSGHLIMEQPDKMKNHIASYKDGTKLLVTVKKVTKSRSLDQNAYYWGVVVQMLGDEIGEEPEEMHEILKGMFLQTHHDKEIMGVIYDYISIRSTTDLTTVEFNDYCERIRRWAAQDLNIIIPDPSGDPLNFTYP